jgi:hypothetical protein
LRIVIFTRKSQRRRTIILQIVKQHFQINSCNISKLNAKISLSCGAIICKQAASARMQRASGAHRVRGCCCCCYDNCVSPAINLPLTRAECARDLRPLCTGPCSPRAGSSSLFAHKSLAQQPTCLCGMRAFCLSRALMLETCARATRHFYFSAARARAAAAAVAVTS